MILLAILVVLKLLPHATQADSRCLTDYPVPQTHQMQWEDKDVTIRLQVAKRPGSQLTARVFRLFLQEVLGFAGVELVTLPDHYNMTAYIRALSDCTSCVDGEIKYGPERNETPPRPPNATINLEVWTPPGYELDRDTQLTHHVMYAGPLGPITRMGWFFQKHVAVSHAGILDHWRAFSRPQTASMFSYSVADRQMLRGRLTDPAGHYYCQHKLCRSGEFVPEWCGPAQCAVLLASRPDEAGFVFDQIAQLRLLVRVYWVGEGLTDVVQRMTQANKTVLFVHYTPSLLTLNQSFVEVAFPICPEGVYCYTGSRHIKKFAWSQLRKGAISVDKALREFQFSQEQYTTLLKMKLTYQNMSNEQVACEWLRLHRHIWQKSWKPAGRPLILIGGIFPIGGTNYKARGVIPAVLMAMNAVNDNSSVLPNYDLSLKAVDGQCSADMVMKSFIDYVRLSDHKHMAGILGPACSDTVEPIAGVSRHYRVVVISYSAEGVLFSNRSQYPYFFRTIGENKQFRFVYKQLLAQLQWKRLASLTEAGQKYSEYISILHDMLQQSGVTFIANRKLLPDTQNMEPYLTDLREKNARIIVADLYEIAARAVMCEAYLKNMTAKQGYVWFLPAWFSPVWYNHTDTKCKPDEILKALDGHLALSHAYFANDSSTMQEGISVAEWREEYRNSCREFQVDESDYAGYAYDAVWTYALGLDKLLKEKPSRFQDFHTKATNARFVDILKATNFNGVSGKIQFVGPSRITTILVKQWRGKGYHVVGHFKPNTTSPDGGRLLLDERKIVWLTPDGRRPVDGTSAPCDLQPLADLLNTTCQNAMVAVNIIGLCLLLCLLCCCVMFYKRRYEKKVLRLRELGLANEAELRLDEWEVKRENVVLNRKLGEGAFGAVYGGEALLHKERPTKSGDKKRGGDQRQDWCSVAVKTLKMNSSIEEKLDFLSEAEVMKQFNHANIVQLLGVCTRSEPILTVMEFMLYGDLKTFLLSRRSLVTDKLFKDENNAISSKKLTSMARDVACALSYLAERKYVHRDVACRNCLINAQHVVKLADFGMTRSMCENDYYRFNRKGMLPVRWMAPESLADGLFTPQSDIWSYGVLLFEIITFGSFPFQGLSNSMVLEFVRNGHHVGVPRGVKMELADLLLSCWSVQRERRPDARDVVELLGLQFPRLIAPCLDVPLSVVQIEGQDTAEVDLNSSRKLGILLGSRPNGRLQRGASYELSQLPEAEQLVGDADGGETQLSAGQVGKYALLDQHAAEPATEATDV